MASQTTSPDSVLQELVAQRNREIEAQHTRRAEQLRASEERGQERLKAVMKHLGGNNAALIQKLDEPHAAQAKEARAYIADIKAKLAEAPASISTTY